ncbi:MAG: HEAT repeat domain-containing protein [Planctomycetes bacterium]|nr:HEAT repeat domain-containing protein [Planctomycetota bacterium]
MILRASLGILAAVATAGLLFAHGGQYTPSTPILPPSLPPSGGSPPGGPSAPKPVATPLTAYRGFSEALDWRFWWEFNKRPFLLRRQVEEELPITGSDDFYLGVRRPEERVDTLAPTEADLIERIVPALAATLGKEHNRDIVTSCLIALGKIGRDGPGVELEQVLQVHVPRDDQEVRETAVLALGIAGREKAYPILAALLRDDAEGRKLVERGEVRDRTRAFAAYGLGLLAARSAETAMKRKVYDELWAPLADPKNDDRDLSVALISALGILRLDDRGADKMLAWQAIDALMDYFAADRGRGFEAVQAHVPIAVARLLGRGTSDLHQKCKAAFADELDAKDPRSHPVLRSCAIALGQLGLPAEEFADDARIARALQRTYEKGRDQGARFLSLMSLGRIGGAASREALVQAYVRGNKNMERPWAALALGVVSFKAGCDGHPDETVARMLLEDLPRASDDSLRGALAIGIGLTGYTTAVPSVLRQLRDNESDEIPAGHLCIALALLGDRSASSNLTQILQRSLRRPFLLQKCAVALGQLGDRAASTALIEMMQQNDSVAVLSALAIALGRIGDRRSIEPLLTMLTDKDLTKIARGFVAAALGGIGDKEELPFNTPLTVDCNYMSAVDTLTNGITGVLDIL